MARMPIGADALRLEITETTMMHEPEHMREILRDLETIGVRSQIDDFGIGYSSLRFLQQFHSDALKIDGSFVKDMISDPLDTAMVESINHIGHVMGKLTIAEFVENDEILARVRELGVDYAQGYGIAKPVPFNEVALRHSGMRQLALLPATADSEQ